MGVLGRLLSIWYFSKNQYFSAHLTFSFPSCTSVRDISQTACGSVLHDSNLGNNAQCSVSSNTLTIYNPYNNYLVSNSSKLAFYVPLNGAHSCGDNDFLGIYGIGPSFSYIIERAEVILLQYSF